MMYNKIILKKPGKPTLDSGVSKKPIKNAAWQ